MFGIIITLAVMCAVLLLMLSHQDNKDASLKAENSLLKGRMEELKNTGYQPLTLEDIERAVQVAGYTPKTSPSEKVVRFDVSGNTLSVDATRLPQVIVRNGNRLRPEDWDFDLLKKAAHQVTNDVIILKVYIEEIQDDTYIIYLIVSHDRSYYCFRDNLPEYIDIIDYGHRRIKEIYDRLAAEKRNESLSSLDKLTSASHQNNRIPS